MKQLTRVHMVDRYLHSPANPILVNLIGAGGNGSQMLSALARMNHALLAFGHPGLFVRLFDADSVTEANLGRQLFSEADLGRNKAVTLINRFNRFFGTDWKGMPFHYNKANLSRMDEQRFANLTFSCVDNAEARFEIADILMDGKDCRHQLYKPIYWTDFGNGRDTGQMIIATINPVPQPRSKKFQPVDTLPLMTVEFKDLLKKAKSDNTPSCSLAEALAQQDLFVNSALVQTGSSLIRRMFSEGVLRFRGLFQNLTNLKTQPIPV